ncbi:hypothetical protein [Actinokineospora spheciospongiae]|nr:hypothetical protein [Actinokineospora spheciospongiae]PWW63453.1 hypothetical protein DFQ13_104445 [Actinokineospora spheciospongiae]
MVGNLVRADDDSAIYEVRFPESDLTVETTVPGYAVTFIASGSHAHHAA